MEQANVAPWELALAMTATPSSEPQVLPRGQVEMVLVVDEARRIDGKKWRLSFEYGAFGYEPDGRPRRDS